jgi:hypothetical protein
VPAIKNKIVHLNLLYELQKTKHHICTGEEGSATPPPLIVLGESTLDPLAVSNSLGDPLPVENEGTFCSRMSDTGRLPSVPPCMFVRLNRELLPALFPVSSVFRVSMLLSLVRRFFGD